MRRVLSLLMVCFLAPTAARAAEPATREHRAPTGWESSYHQLHYTPVVKIGDTVIVSGIPAMEGEDEPAKIRWAFEQLQAHLEEAGASLADVVELTSFHMAGDSATLRRQIDTVLSVHRDFFKDHYPAWTAVGTSALYSEGAPLELRAMAIIGSGQRPKSHIAPLPEAATEQ